MPSVTKTLKTADTTGYVVNLGAECSTVSVGCRTGSIWVQPFVKSDTAPTNPTSAAVPAAAGDVVDFVQVLANESKDFDLSDGFSQENQRLRYTHVRVWSVAASNVEVMGG